MKFIVEGMTCGHCIRTITQAIQRIDPGAKVNVNLAEKTVSIDGHLDPGIAEAVVENEGYTVVSVELNDCCEAGAPEPTDVCCGSCHAEIQPSHTEFLPEPS